MGRRCWLGLSLLLLCVGCSAYRSVNTPLSQIDVTQQLHPSAQSSKEQRPEEIAVILALSGGGTRAAAFSYGCFKNCAIRYPSLAF